MKNTKKKVNKRESKKVKHKKDKSQKKNLNILKINEEFKLIPLIINILIPLGSGFVVGYLNKNSMDTYNTLKKIPFTPPDMAFSIIWGILYVLMGIAAYRIYMKNKKGINDSGAYFFYLVQLIFNLMWSFIFFTFRLYAISFFWIIIIFILVVIAFVKFIKVDKIAGFLLIPYTIWLVFAGILNYFILERKFL